MPHRRGEREGAYWKWVEGLEARYRLRTCLVVGRWMRWGRGKRSLLFCRGKIGEFGQHSFSIGVDSASKTFTAQTIYQNTIARLSILTWSWIVEVLLQSLAATVAVLMIWIDLLRDLWRPAMSLSVEDWQIGKPRMSSNNMRRPREEQRLRT